tara:strand:- start:817 stop:1065 length:249 start_codon:yes stop_codon:yes gene_type:complete
MKKLGRPKKVGNKKNNIYVGMHMSRELAEALNKDAASHFRMRTQHIMWILDTYIKNQGVKTNQPLYTEEEIKDMYEQYRESE